LLKTASGAAVFGAIVAATPASADEGGVSFWVPGFFGSLAATPQQAGFSIATIYYHADVTGGGNVAFARQVSRGALTTNFTGGLNASIKANADLGMVAPSYVFAQPILGAQASVALLIPFGHAQATVDATLAGNLGLGGPGFTIGGSRTDDVTGVGDVLPQFTLRWNEGVHNFMTYVTGNLTVGAYDQNSLANLGLGHNAVDAGGGYTYFNPQTGNELSGTLGFTYNFMNDHTQYQSGVDMHFDWGASRFVTKQWQIGLVGYAYQQISCDSGGGDRLGCFESRVLGIGPQVGYVMPWGTDHQVYFNLKAYKEFDAAARADGWNAWFTVAITPAAAPPPAAKPLLTK
jgi:hypothetical protein